MIDVDRVRADTPAATRRAYFQNAGSSLPPAPVLAAQIRHLELEAEIGGYAAEAQESAALEAVYDSVAQLIGASSTEIALAESATAAWQLAFGALRFSQGDVILTAEAEYAANYVAYLQTARRHGARVEVVPSDAQGVVDVDALARRIDARTKLIALTWAPSNGGLLNPAAEVGRVARAHGVPYLLDACQAVGQLPVSVDELGCDFLAATGRKFLRGPRGTGFLYVREGKDLEPHLLDHYGATLDAQGGYRMRADARRFGSWEASRAGQLGLGAAVAYALELGLDAIHARCTQLASRLREELAAMPGVQVMDLGVARSAIVTFTVAGHEAAAVVAHAAARGVVIGVSPPVSTPLDSAARNLPPLVRASPHYFNDDADLDQLIAAVRSLP